MGKRQFTETNLRILSVLRERGPKAITMSELRRRVGGTERAFLNAYAGLQRKNLIFRWDNERFVGYAVLAEHKTEAFYEEEVRTPSLCQFFGQPARVTVKRSAPFVILADEQRETRNRYRLDCTVA